MNRVTKWGLLCLMLVPASLWATDPPHILDLHHLERLSKVAAETVNVNLDGSMLQLASNFMSNKDADQMKVKTLLGGLQAIYVRSFQFKNNGEYSQSDLKSIRSQLSGPNWSRIVQVSSSADGDNAEIYLLRAGNTVKGLAIIAAEPKELTVVQIMGSIDVSTLQQLQGSFGIPDLGKKKK